MADQQVLLIESQCHISMDTGRVLFKKPDGHTRTELAEDIAVLCLHHEQITISHHALRALSQANCALITTDAQHIPCGILHPLSQQSATIANTRLHEQIRLEFTTERKAQLWQSLIAQKIHNSAVVLRMLKLNGALRLERLAQQVQPDDATNAEGQAAKYYWQQWFAHPQITPVANKRLKQNAGDMVNARLNYAYAILRAMISREIIIAGLNPSLGVGHINKGNPFNLADDLIEPYRCVAEWAVAQTEDFEAEFIGIEKQYLLRDLMVEVKLTHDADNQYRLPQAISQTVQSYCRALSEPNQPIKLKLPKELHHENQSS